MEIYILSSGRANKQTTWHSLPKAIQERTAIVVPKAEAEDYKDGSCKVIGIDAKGIGASRQWCVENAPSGHVCMLDDDLVFATRRADDPCAFSPATDSEIVAMFEDIDFNLTLFGHVGVSTREGGNRRTEDYVEVNRMLRILCYQTDLLKANKIRFDRLPVMEDFDVTLRLLRLGIPNRILNYIVHNQNGSNLSGGCSQYRTKEVQAAAAKKLAEVHYPFVSLVQKETKAAWGGGVRTDVVIQWKKAYGSAPKQ